VYYVIHTKVDGIILEYFVNGHTLQLEKMNITDKMNRTANAIYTDYRKIDGFGDVAYERTFVFPYSNTANATINMKFSEIEIDVPKEIKFSIPKNYEKIN
jgi:tRNA A37 threonylcarbamoyltransferase TsaD